MARRSGINGAGDALDLFLDTICNAFGGIIFISLLVCVMLQLTSKVHTVSEDPQPKRQLDSLWKEIETVEREITAQEKQIAALQGTVDKPRFDEYRRLKDKARKLREENKGIDEKIDEVRGKQPKQDERLTAATREGEVLTTEIATIKGEIEELKKRRGVTLSVPGERETKKKGVPVLLSGGRLTFANLYNQAGDPAGVNPEIDVRKLQGPQPGQIIFELRPMAGKGLLFEGAKPLGTPEEHETRIKALEAKLAPLLKKFTPNPGGGKTEDDCRYIEIAVWPDSFPQFEVLRDLLLRLGFDYNVVLVEPGKPVQTGGKRRTQ